MGKRIGVISDTHGLLRDEATGRLKGCDMIIHAGDVGGPAILEELRRIAPLVAVRGNVDTGAWAGELPEIEYVQIEGTTICIIHDIVDLDVDPAAAGVSVVIHGHSHKPVAEWKDGILYLNPGSAGPLRFHLPVSMAFLHVRPEGVAPEIVALQGDIL
jgi:putative phosphoesterase